MKILWHSNAPWAPTGYGTQTAIWVPRLAELGHEIAISAFHGLQSGPQQWQGHKVYPAGQNPYGGDIVGRHAAHFGADWVIMLMDQWAMQPADTLAGMNVAPWMPVDAEPLGVFDYDQLKAKQDACKQVVPIALSRFGQAQLADAGFTALYCPHGIDTQDVWTPPKDKKALREAMGIDDKFVIFMDAANLDKQRKGFSEQFAAFSRFHSRHADSLLVVHSLQYTQSGLNLPEMAARMGCLDAVKFSEQYLHTAGLIRPEQLRGSYGMADLYTGCSLAEGFGLGPVQALSCGVPAAVTGPSDATKGSTMPEVTGPGSWLVKSEQAWAAGHNSWWSRPLIGEICKAYEKAYRRDGPYHAKAKAGREHVVANYDIDVVLKNHWAPVLEELEARL